MLTSVQSEKEKKHTFDYHIYNVDVAYKSEWRLGRGGAPVLNRDSEKVWRRPVKIWGEE